MSAFTQTTVDGIVVAKPCVLYSVVLTASVAGVADVLVYEGQDTSSGRLVIVVKTAASTTAQVRWNGLELGRGLYLDLGSNVASVTVEYEVSGVIT